MLELNTKDILVFDIEGNGLLDEITEIYCICFEDLVGNCYSLVRDEITPEAVMSVFNRYKAIACHNMIDYDLPVLKKLLGLSLYGQKICIDTLIWSKTLYPDRPIPKKCPRSIYNPVTKKKQIVTPHGLECWGFRVGISKPKIHDWRTFEPAMVHRCEEDVKINIATLQKLIEEARDEN